MRYVLPLLIGVLLSACSPDPSREDTPERLRMDTLSYHSNGSPNRVAVRRGDSVVERRAYRRTGTLRRVAAGDSVRTYFDLNDPDSAAVLKDYLHGRWRNLSADTSQEQASAFYIFESDRLTFENPTREVLESLDVEYKDQRTLTTEDGMTARPEILSFDTVRVTGYTLVRIPTDSL